MWSSNYASYPRYCTNTSSFECSCFKFRIEHLIYKCCMFININCIAYKFKLFIYQWLLYLVDYYSISTYTEVCRHYVLKCYHTRTRRCLIAIKCGCTVQRTRGVFQHTYRWLFCDKCRI